MPESEDWHLNYFNYFTEVEEHFRKQRGTGLFLMSPLDWALVESWKNAGIPLPAVLRGIDAAFEKWRTRKVRRQNVNSIAYCAQAVMHEAGVAGPAAASAPKHEIDAPFSIDELRGFLNKNADVLRKHANPAFHEIGSRLSELAERAAEEARDLQDLDMRLTALEEKLAALVRASQSEEDLLQARRTLESELRPYRGKMSTEQLAMLERQYLDRYLFERAKLPRLSLFYLI